MNAHQRRIARRASSRLPSRTTGLTWSLTADPSSPVWDAADAFDEAQAAHLAALYERARLADVAADHEIELAAEQDPDGAQWRARRALEREAQRREQLGEDADWNPFG